MTNLGGAPWKLERFPETLNIWIDICSPSSELRRIVRTWVVTRYEDPYEGMRREPDIDNLWYGVVPGSNDGYGNVVVCSYFIVESTRTVRCNSCTTLSLPVL